MKPKFRISETVRIKATGEKVKILEDYGNLQERRLYYTDDYFYYFEDELKPFRPSRTGKYRNEKGQFVSKETNKCKGCGVDLLAQEQQDHFTYPNSKQRNYQKILTKLDVLEKKIDELGSKI